WLSDIGWQPFPTIAAEPQLLSELNDAAPESTSTTVADAGPTGKQRAVSEVSTATPSRAVAPAITAPVPASADDAAHPATIAEGNVAANPKPSVAPAAAAPASTAPHERAEILDLQSFLGRLDGFMQQLRNAELPATGVMLQALGLSQAENGQAASSWEHAVSLVQRNLRGIDVVCLYQTYTLCIFMPGCSLDAAIDRGSKLQANLRTAQEQWPGEVCPQRFAIALAGVGDTEDSARFLNRLEGALEEGVDASVNELVVHTGEACHFQQV
ncbi:MAG: hypothetical protein KDA45_03465, partial [Planctomycetales bacterium]|nr:hypothetical protein [Planctomycetales bacterium]